MLRTYVMLNIYRNELTKRLAAEDGQDLIEYALLVALISIALVAVLPGVADAIEAVFTSIQATLNGAT